MYFADGHCDFLYGMANSGYDLKAPVGNQSVSLGRLKAGNVKLQLFAAWIDVEHRRPYLSQFMSMADAFERMLEENPELVRLTPDFDPEGGSIAVMLTIE